MTFALSLALIVGPKTVELPKAGANKVVVQVFVPAPNNMSDREQAAWNVLADVLYDGTAEFSRDRLAQFGSQAGVPILIEAMPEHLRLQVVEPKGGFKVAMQILESLCERATLSDSQIAESTRRLKTLQLSSWEQAVFDEQLPYTKVTSEVVRNLYQVAFRPESFTIVAGGEVPDVDLAQEVSDRFKPLASAPPRRTRFDYSPRPWAKHGDSVSTFELRLAPLNLASADSTARLLAVFALGVGKGSAMHRVLREGKGWSYRQEAVLWPSKAGWIPRLLFASTQVSLEEGLTARELLSSDVDTWTAETVARARSMAEATFAGTNPLSPLTTGRDPFGSELEDECALYGLSMMMYGASPKAIDQAVSVDELKAAAKDLLEHAGASVIPRS